MFGLLTFLSSCTQDDTNPKVELFFGQEFIQLKTGNEAIFQVDSTIYDEFSGRIKIVSFQQKEVITTEEKDAANRSTYLVEIHKRTNDTLPWRLDRITRRTLTSHRFEVLDNNILTVPLIFPIKNGEKWNVNILNARNEQEYEYSALNESINIRSVTYDSTVTILQGSEENLVERILEEEVYAKGIGLVQRTHNNLETELNGDIRSGFEVKITLLSP